MRTLALLAALSIAALVIGIADYTLTIGDVTFNGIALGTLAAIVVYHGEPRSSACVRAAQLTAPEYPRLGRRVTRSRGPQRGYRAGYVLA